MKVLGEERCADRVHASIKDMYEGVRTRVRTTVGDTDDFSIDIGLHQGSAEPFSVYYSCG